MLIGHSSSPHVISSLHDEHHHQGEAPQGGLTPQVVSLPGRRPRLGARHHGPAYRRAERARHCAFLLACGIGYLAGSTEGSPSTPWPLSSVAAEALFAAVEAKRNLLAAEEVLSRCTAHLSQLVDLGVLVPKGLPVVAGFVLFQNEGRRTFSYPEEIKAMEAGVRKHKKLAEQLGTAIEKVGEPYWTIRPDTAAQGPAL